jgi:hypothetical protein
VEAASDSKVRARRVIRIVVLHSDNKEIRRESRGGITDTACPDASAASGRHLTSAGKCGQINDGWSIPPWRFERVLIGTYKLLILGHYLPQRFFLNDLLQACTPTPYIMAESSSDLQVSQGGTCICQC